jgi:hypothetical protein
MQFRITGPRLGISLVFLTIAAPAYSAIRDEGQLFSPAAVQEADTMLRQISRQHGKDVIVETFAAIPPNLQSRFNSMERSKFFREWASERARAQNINGVYLLLVQTPGRLEWNADEATRRSAFTPNDGERLTELMVPLLKRENYDSALLQGVRYIQTRLNENLSGAGSASGSGSVNPLPGPAGTRVPRPADRPAERVPMPPDRPTQRPTQGPVVLPSTGLCGAGIGKWICLGVGFLIIWSMVKGMRRLRSGGGYAQRPYGGGAPPYGGSGSPGGFGGAGSGLGGGGGGLGRGIFGGLLGGLFGSWLGGKMTDQRTHGDTPPSGGGFFGDRHDAAGGMGGGGFTGGDVPGPTDYSGGGADLGGGDFGGGGDSGGGGGGGDAGGGSDF